MDIKETFEKEGFKITPQAINLLEKIGKEEYTKDILKQLKERKFILAGGDIVKYLITNKISDTVVNSEDI